MIFDNFLAQKTDAVLKQLKDNYIHTSLCTSKLYRHGRSHKKNTSQAILVW